MDIIEGERILFRRITLADISDEYLSWLNDDEIRMYIESPPPKPYTKEMLEVYLKQMIADKEVYMYAMIDKATNTHFGNVKLHNFSWTNGTCEYGMIIGNKDFWGKEYGVEASKMIFDFAFRTLHMRKMWATIKENNPRIIRMVEKLGFKQEGRLIRHTLSDGKFVDKIIIGLFSPLESNA